MQPYQPQPRVWNTGVALDASSSLKKAFGRRIVGSIPASIIKDYKKKGWTSRGGNLDGRRVRSFARAAVDDAVRRGLVTLSPNIMDYLAPEFIGYMAKTLAVNGKTALIYWAGGNGSEIESVGDLNGNDGYALIVDGPEAMMFGDKTMLLPAVKFLVERYPNSNMGMFVFVSDGHIDDLADLKQYTINLAREIAANQKKYVKCILVGIGDDVDERSMRELVALNAKTYVNIWSFMFVNDLQDLIRIFAEITGDVQIVARCGSIYDDQGNLLMDYSNGLPAAISFSMSLASQWFELRLDDLNIRQVVRVPNFILEGLG